MTLVAFPAAAISRYNSERLSCAQVHAIIRNEGAAIMRYPSRFTGNILYDRYVADSSLCVLGKYAQSTSIPTADRDHCPVYHCVDIQYDEDN